MRRAVVVGAIRPGAVVLPAIEPGELVVAADSGLEAARSLGLTVDVVVGDLDSVADDALARARREGVRIEEHPGDKDETDLELALAVATAVGAAEIDVVLDPGGRLDHAMANLAVLASPRWVPARVRALVGQALVTIVRPGPPAELSGAVGDLVSLLPIGAPADGVTTTGLRWQLVGETLEATAGRGVSNELCEERASVQLRGGVLAVVQPDVSSPVR